MATEKTSFASKFTGKNLLLGLQHMFAMFGATVLVPALTGLNPAVALICAGVGTLMFHLITKRKVPVFLGSSFAFIAGIQAIVMPNGDGVVDKSRIPAAQGGIIAAGLVYCLIALIVYFVGVERIKKVFPPIVTGPVIIIIGLTLSPTAINMASSNWGVALITLAIVIGISVFAKGFFKLVPILIGIIGGYLVSIAHDLIFPTAEKLVNFQLVADASWISPFWDFTSGDFFTLPQFEFKAIMILAPIAIVTFMEHIGDITTNGSVVGQDFFTDPACTERFWAMVLLQCAQACSAVPLTQPTAKTQACLP